MVSCPLNSQFFNFFVRWCQLSSKERCWCPPWIFERAIRVPWFPCWFGLDSCWCLWYAKNLYLIHFLSFLFCVGTFPACFNCWRKRSTPKCKQMVPIDCFTLWYFCYTWFCKIERLKLNSLSPLFLCTNVKEEPFQFILWFWPTS